MGLEGALTWNSRRGKAHVDDWARNKVLAASESDLTDYLVAKYLPDAPTLRGIHRRRRRSRCQPRLQTRAVAGRTAHADSRPPRVRESTFRRGPRPVRLPASNRNFNPPCAKQDSLLTFTVTVPHDDADAERIRQEIDAEVANTKSYMDWVRQDCAAWNARLPVVAADCLNARKRHLLQQADLLGQPGIPLTRREHAGDAFSIPIPRRPGRPPAFPATLRAAFQPEPVIAHEDYDFILELIA